MDTEKLLNSIKAVCSSKRTVIVGIDGLGGAGKSTVSELLLARLKSDGNNIILLHIDDFIHTRAVRYNSDYAPWECYYNLQWRYDYLIKEIIEPVRAGLEVNKDIELYNKDNDTYITEHLNIPVGSIVIIEGVFLQRSEIRHVFDYMIYMDISEETRLSRVLRRDGYIGNEDDIREKYENRYFPAERHYVSTCSPQLNADFIVKE